MSEKIKVRHSWQQDNALRFIRNRREVTRMDLYGGGIRMPTIYSLVRRGFVVSEYRKCGDARSRYFYRLNEQ